MDGVGTFGTVPAGNRSHYPGTEIVRNRCDYSYTLQYKDEEFHRYYEAVFFKNTKVVSGNRVDEYEFKHKEPLNLHRVLENECVLGETTYKYDQNKMPTEEIRKRYQYGADGARQEFSAASYWRYDDKGNLESERGPLSGAVITGEYNDYAMPGVRHYYSGGACCRTERYEFSQDAKTIRRKAVYDAAATLREAVDYDCDRYGNVVLERHYAAMEAGSPKAGPGDRLIQYTYENGVHMTFRELSGGLLDENIRESWRYDACGRLRFHTNANGYTAEYRYDALGRLTETLLPLTGHSESVRHTEYLDSGNAPQNHVVVTDEEYNRTRYEYTPLGMISAVYLLGEGETMLRSCEYDSRGRLRRESVYSGEGAAETSYAYDAQDRVMKKATRAPGVAERDESYSYDDAHQGRCVRENRRIAGDAASPPVYMYTCRDALGRVCEEAVGGSVTLTGYDEAGNTAWQRDPLGNEVRWSHDYAGRAVSETRQTDQGEVSSHTGYDAFGNTVYTRDFGGNAKSFVYDAAGRMVERRGDLYGGGHRTKGLYSYDPAGNLIRERVLCGAPGEAERYRQTNHEYDGQGRVIRSVQGGHVTEYEYDRLGNRTLTRVGAGPGGYPMEYHTSYNRHGKPENVWQTQEDAIGKPTHWKPVMERFEYDPYGRLSEKRDKNGAAVTYRYDALGQPLGESAEDAHRSWSYTKTGQMAVAENGGLRVEYTYDDQGRLIRETETGKQGAAHRVVKEYAYDACGNRTRFTLHKDSAVQVSQSYEYDCQNRLVKVWSGGVPVAEYGYDANGNRNLLRYPQSGLETRYGYNGANLVSWLEQRKDSQVRGRWEYEYYLDGNQREKRDRDGVTGYVYDALGRLERESRPGGEEARYEYDNCHNRKRMTVSGPAPYTVDYKYSQNQLVEETRVRRNVTEVHSCTYDKNGSQLMRRLDRYTHGGAASPGGVTLETGASAGSGAVLLETRRYNGLGQLTELWSDARRTCCSYRPDGLRHRKSSPDSEMTHLWDGQNIVAEYAGSGNMTARYLRGIGLIAREQDAALGLQYYLHNAHAMYTETNVVNLAGSGKKLTKSTDKIHIKRELTKRSLQNN